jgi:peroxiredoxin
MRIGTKQRNLNRNFYQLNSKDMLAVGQKAPDFHLLDTEKQRKSLDDFKGKNIVLFFFPFAFTSTCTKEMCEVQEDLGVYQKLNALPIGVSIDTLYTLKKFKEEYRLNDVTFLSDFNKEAIRAYDVCIEEYPNGYKGVGMRATFLIDKSGVLRYVEVLPSVSDYPDMNALKKELEKLS